MKTLIRTNGNYFPALPSLIEDFFNRDLVDSSTFNWRSNDGTMPAVNISETNDDYRIEVAAPGMKRESFKVELDNNVLTIASHVDSETESKDEKKDYTRREFNYQSFQRSFSIPESKVMGDKITARYTDGILYITVPKKEEAKVKPARQITVS
jgi:HSP20 family protein